MSKKISVCIPTYNQEKYVETAIQSVLRQTVPIHEIIVCNDCSTDGTQLVLDSMAEEIPNLKCLHNPINLGISKNVKQCLEMAEGDFIIRLDSDDILNPDFAKRLSDQMIKYPDAGYAHAAVQQIDQFGNHQKIRSLFRSSGFQDGNTALKNAAKGFKVSANIIMYKKDALKKVNYFMPFINFAEDYYLITSISSNGFGNVYLDEVLSQYRVWTDSGQVRKKRKLEEILGLNSLISELLEPAFIKRGWSKKPILKMRKSLSIALADSLQWKIYSNTEKSEIRKALFLLDSSLSTKLVSFLYVNRLGFAIDIYKSSINSAKSIIKSTVSYFKKFIRRLNPI